MDHKKQKALKRKKQKIKMRNERQHSHRANRAKPLRKEKIGTSDKKPGGMVKAGLQPDGKVVVTDKGEESQFPSLKEAMDEFGSRLDFGEGSFEDFCAKLDLRKGGHNEQ